MLRNEGSLLFLSWKNVNRSSAFRLGQFCPPLSLPDPPYGISTDSPYALWKLLLLLNKMRSFCLGPFSFLSYWPISAKLVMNESLNLEDVWLKRGTSREWCWWLSEQVMGSTSLLPAGPQPSPRRVLQFLHHHTHTHQPRICDIRSIGCLVSPGMLLVLTANPCVFVFAWMWFVKLH